LVGPEIVLFATLRFGSEHWYYCFPILGVITLFFALWLMFTPIKREQSVSETISMADSFSLLKDKIILILFLGIFFIVGVDVATNYISSKLMAVRYDWSAEQVKFAPQVYFLSRTIGALLGTFLLARISGIRYFRVNIIACAASLLLLMFVDGATLNLLCIGGIGFFASSVFSIIYSLAFQECPSKMNQISGLMITAVAGGGVVTPILGFAIDLGGITAGLFVVLLCVAYLMYCAFGIKVKKVS
jgi:fucose permease